MEPGNRGAPLLIQVAGLCTPGLTSTWKCCPALSRMWLSLPELTGRPASAMGHGAKVCSDGCCFQGSFLLSSLSHALAPETGWPRPCLTNDWLCVFIVRRGQETVDLFCTQRNGLCSWVCVLVSWWVKCLTKTHKAVRGATALQARSDTLEAQAPPRSFQPLPSLCIVLLG